MKWFWLSLFFLIVLSAPLAPLQAASCNEAVENIISNDNARCSAAELRDRTAPNFCENQQDARGRMSCRLTADRGRCLPTYSAIRLFNDCTRERYARSCTGLCPSSLDLQHRIEGRSTPQAVSNEPPSFEPILPRLQIPIPELQPFTAPLSAVTPEGKTVLVIDFLAKYIIALYKYLVGIAGVTAGIMLVYAGFKWLTSAGSPERITDAKAKLAGAAVGLVLVLGSYVILNLINPELTIFKPIRVEYIQRELLSFEPKMDESADASELPALNCTQPGVAITSLAGVDTKYRSEIQPLLANKTAYQQAAAVAGVPWEMIATVHYKEAGGTPNQSALNGGKICNTEDDPTLLSWCAECRTPTTQNDLICAGKLLKKKVGALSPTTTDLTAIKLAFCKFNGCPSTWRSCPEASPYVGPFFDANHQNYTKSGLDCITANCKPDCTTDATISPRAPRGCCTIKVFAKGRPPPAGFSGSLCNSNQGSRFDSRNCKIAETSNTNTYKYIPGERSSAQPCGSWERQRRIGALAIYALLKRFGNQ